MDGTTDPDTTLHSAANGNIVNGVYAQGASGFNLADVAKSELDSLPAGDKSLVYLGMTDRPPLWRTGRQRHYRSQPEGRSRLHLGACVPRHRLNDRAKPER
jgi:hypothetical protein